MDACNRLRASASSPARPTSWFHCKPKIAVLYFGMMTSELIVIGGGLAGSEAAWQAAQRGVQVTLYEMRPVRPTAAHATDKLAEIVCSNSLGSNTVGKASGLLKE